MQLHIQKFKSDFYKFVYAFSLHVVQAKGNNIYKIEFTAIPKYLYHLAPPLITHK